jgi:hypothetical protein
MGLRQGSVLCSSSSREYPRTKGTNQNRHWNHHYWHATNILERTRLSCWCLYNHNVCTYRAPVRYVTKTWSVVLLNKKMHILLSQVYCVWQVVKTPTIILNNPILQSLNIIFKTRLRKNILLGNIVTFLCLFSKYWRLLNSGTYALTRTSNFIFKIVLVSKTCKKAR